MTIRCRLHRMVHASLLVFLVLYLQVSFVSAQEIIEEQFALQLAPVLRFTHLNSDDGLVQNNVEAILQDRNGFIWFGTQGGLSRYDGYSFISFQHDPNNSNSLTHNHITDLHEDRDGMIWITTEGGGINRLDPTTLEFNSYAAPLDELENWNGIVGDRHFAVLQDSRGHIWAGGTSVFGLSDYDPTTAKAEVYYPNSETGGLLGNGLRDIIETDERQLWIAAEFAISRYDLNTGLFTNYDLREVGERRVASLLEDSNGRIWAGGTNGLYKLNPETDKFDFYPEPREVNDILEFDTGILWLATQHGLYQFDSENAEIIRHDEHSAAVSDSLSNSALDELYQDRSGMIWIAGDSGLDIYDPHLARFDYFRHTTPGLPGSFGVGEIQSIFVSGGIAWIGVDSTLHQVDLATNSVTLYPLEEYGLSNQLITSILQDHTGMVWMGDSTGRLLQFDPTTEMFTEYRSFGTATTSGTSQQPPPRPRQTTIVALHEDDEHQLWVVLAQGGIYRLDETRENTTEYGAPAAERPPGDALPSNLRIEPPITGMNVDGAGNLWVTNSNGLFRFDPITGTYTRIRLLTKQGSDTYTEAVLEDRNGIIWIASRDGLFRLDPETQSIRSYTIANGLPTNFLVGVLQDEAGDLWISSKKGLSRFAPASGTFRNYDRFDGLQGNEFSSRVFAQASDGRMFFGGPNGLTAFYPQRIIDSSYQSQVVLEDFELFNQPVQPGKESPLTQPIWLTNSLTLKHNQNILTFEFAVLNYAFGDNNQYRYRLDGLETEWNQTDSTRRFATYTNLSAGDYVFQVQAANKDGVWSAHEVALKLTVQPPWWETTWFRIGAALSLTAVLWIGYRWRIRRIARHNRELQQEVETQTQALKWRTNELQASETHLRRAKEAADAANHAKTAFLANMSHELRSPLNAILGFAQVMNRDTKLPRDARENLGVILRSGEHLLSLINQVLDLSKIEAGHMSLNETNFDLFRLLDDLEDMFTLTTEDKRLKLIFERADDVPRYLSADAIKLRQTLINLIGNALKFTAKGSVSVRVAKLRGDSTLKSPSLQLRFEVEDTGPGIAADELSDLFEAFAQTSTGRKAHEGTGLGLAISRRFIRLMGGDIQVKSSLGEGTSFTFDITCTVVPEIEVHAETMHRQIIGLAPNQSEFRIVIVDDKWANRQVMMKLLQPLGFKMIEAENGLQAIELIPTFQPHLIWMDIRMPVMDGIEAIQQLKAMPIANFTKIIALTASAYDEEKAGILALGFDDFARKPIKADTVFELLSRHVGVKYIYADADLQQTVPAQEPLSLSEIRTALSVIPPSLLFRLSEGTELGDLAIIDETITEIRKHHAALAEALYRLIQHFQFDELLVLLREQVSQ